MLDLDQSHPTEFVPPRRRKGLAIASLVLGLLSLPTLGLLLVGAILGVVLGITALVKANTNRMEYGGEGLAVAGIAASVVSVLVMPIFLGIVAGVAMPSLLRRRVAANESATVADIRAVLAAQHSYQASNAGFYDTLDCLARPSACIPGYSGPSFLDGGIASLQPRAGYTRRFHPGPSPDRDRLLEKGLLPRVPSSSSMTYFAYVALPVDRGSTGVRAFCGDASGRICYVIDGTMPDLAQSICPTEDCIEIR